MTEPRIDVSIMAHPGRSAAAEVLCTQLAADFPTKIIYDPDPDGPHSTIRTARLAWRPHDRQATHHLLVQDDVVLRPDFAACVRQVAHAQPDRWVSLACEWGCRTAWVCRDAALANRPYGPVVDNYIPLWGLLMPASQAADLADHLATVDLNTPDDHALAQFVDANRLRPPLITVPNLLVHGELPSLIGNDNRLGHRGTALVVDQPVPDGWWARPPLEPEAGAPVMIYFLATAPYVLRAPGHNGYDLRSVYFTAEQLSETERAWRADGISLDHTMARAFTNVCLAYRNARTFAATQEIPTSDPVFSEALHQAGTSSLVHGMFRTLFTDETRDQAELMISYLDRTAGGKSGVDAVQ